MAKSSTFLNNSRSNNPNKNHSEKKHINQPSEQALKFVISYAKSISVVKTSHVGSFVIVNN
jgi:hypothetical protein